APLTAERLIEGHFQPDSWSRPHAPKVPPAPQAQVLARTQSPARSISPPPAWHPSLQPPALRQGPVGAVFPRRRLVSHDGAGALHEPCLRIPAGQGKSGAAFDALPVTAKPR